MKIISNIPKKRNLEVYNKILSKVQGVDHKLNKVLNNYFSDDKHFIDNVYAGITIKHPTIKELNDINLMTEIGIFITDPDNDDLSFEIKLEMLSKELKLGTNKIFQLYEQYKFYIGG
jgi:hypothetical protein